jgi:hypothetical protein
MRFCNDIRIQQGQEKGHLDLQSNITILRIYHISASCCIGTPFKLYNIPPVMQQSQSFLKRLN